jgi:hypothetical protein
MPIGRSFLKCPHCPAHIKALWEAGEIAIGWTYSKPLRQLPTESLARVRRARLKRRLTKKAPLFAEELFAKELNARPAFFAGSRDLQTEPALLASLPITLPESRRPLLMPRA